jgi:hypothetical protein
VAQLLENSLKDLYEIVVDFSTNADNVNGVNGASSAVADVVAPPTRLAMTQPTHFDSAVDALPSPPSVDPTNGSGRTYSAPVPSVPIVSFSSLLLPTTDYIDVSHAAPPQATSVGGLGTS